MGFFTNVTLNNDRLQWVEEHPQEFVSAIRSQMNDGMMTSLHAARQAEEEGEKFFNPRPYETQEAKAARVNGVKVHQAQHADVDQVIVTHQGYTVPAHELPQAIRQGMLDRSVYGLPDRQRCERTVKALREMAARIEAEL